MLQFYYLVLRIVSPPALMAFYVVNKMTKARRARILLSRRDGQILLVVNALGDQRWSLPGGGVGRRESDERAILREVHEELRVKLEPARLKLLGDVSLTSYVAPVFIYELHDDEARNLDRNKAEIRELRWASSHELPPNRQELIDHALALVDK